MKKLKEFSKKYLIGFTLGLLSAGIVSVAAAAVFPSNQTTYDNSNTGMQATEVQGALDELYTTCFPPKTGDSILDKEPIVTTGDGLYEDEYEEGKYTYKGKKPNNYVTFNNEEAGWRIISINSDGTIKIMRYEGIGDRAWDTSGSTGNNNWNRPATLNTYLNGTYYNKLSSVAKSQIVSANYSIGAVTFNNNDMQDQINDEKSVVSNVKIALPTASEYIRASSNTSCKTFKTFSPLYEGYSTCIDSDWMYKKTSWWTLSPNSDDSDHVFYVLASGNLQAAWVDEAGMMVRPVVTLSSEVQITGGDGSKSNPYTIE